jgi:hypothetical protein
MKHKMVLKNLFIHQEEYSNAVRNQVFIFPMNSLNKHTEVCLFGNGKGIPPNLQQTSDFSLGTGRITQIQIQLE